MTDRNRIKVIKKNEAVKVRVKKSVKTKPAAAAREMVSTVTDWVSDIRDRKREETKRAIESLFSQNPQPSES